MSNYGHQGSSRVNIDLIDREESHELGLRTMESDISIIMSGKEPTQKKNGKEEHQESEKMGEND